VRPPSPHPFLAAESGEPTPDIDAIIVGLAADGGVSFRPGAVDGPSGIRAFSESIETYSPRTGRDLSDLRIVDIGDHTERETVEKAFAVILDAAWTSGRRPLVVSLGGDHSVTPPAVAAVAARAEHLAVVGFDAHLDLREDYPGDHACTYRRISELGPQCFVFGVRSGAREEWRDVPLVLASVSRSVMIPSGVHRRLEGRPVYVTVDIDVLNSAAAPGTGNPEPGGPAFEELLESLESLEGLDVVGFDVVEVSPPLDPSGITQSAAAVLVREAILRFSPR
jgi:agmatinase